MNADPGLEKLRTVKRRAVTEGRGLVTAQPLFTDRALPLLIEPSVSALDPVAWATRNRDFIEAGLRKHGGILFRNFNIKTAEQFAQFMAAIAGELLNYNERSSPRTQVSDHVYTSTDYPSDYSIFVHNENSYQRQWPMKIFFFCETPAESGGETPIADCRRVYASLPETIKERFWTKNWMYVRNFGDGFGLPWRTVFQTDDRAVVEEHCRRNEIDAEWKSDDRLRLRAVRRALHKHPYTGEEVWFNHATFFHISTMEPAIREALLAEVAEDDLPSNSYYGDGSPIEPEVLEDLRERYHEATVLFAWQRGDTLLLDNMLVAHGRAPYKGARKILVGMAQPFGYMPQRSTQS
ncbi:MAG TPA: TauD/TfdA family dioxygenase [Pyrinomonadaceae bacterium]